MWVNGFLVALFITQQAATYAPTANCFVVRNANQIAFHALLKSVQRSPKFKPKFDWLSAGENSFLFWPKDNKAHIPTKFWPHNNGNSFVSHAPLISMRNTSGTHTIKKDD